MFILGLGGVRFVKVADALMEEDLEVEGFFFLHSAGFQEDGLGARNARED
eukprot:CAMPEP_0170553104 /NCGR_PEP_ID=MMETSP0211-20121228/10948_1 /TAXON_ID=311385 /ORGANISM="Pseudokeronopsis sp., Strain OXSARD2" /LENGTH=49 /DNA_ID=CAMNT_0010861233 /DNA_START=651 /DNA_END=800 /DNA_ORIENTATION=-